MTETYQNSLSKPFGEWHHPEAKKLLFNTASGDLSYYETSVLPDCSLGVAIQKRISATGFTPPAGTSTNADDWNIAAIALHK